jgi:hypothetical protein
MRLKPQVVVEMWSHGFYPNELRPRGICLHSVEGQNHIESAADLRGLGALFLPRSFGASCTVGVDSDGHSGRYVHERDAAWHCADFNRVLLGIEHLGFAVQRQWSEKELREAARWIAQWSYNYGIPIRRGRISGGNITRWGVFTHHQLGSAGGGHVDPGDGYPVDHVLDLAQKIKAQRYQGRRRHHR